MDEDTERYVRGEITRALSGHPEGEPLRIKIRGEEHETHWLRVTEPQVRAIRELLATGDLEAVREVLAREGN